MGIVSILHIFYNEKAKKTMDKATFLTKNFYKNIKCAIIELYLRHSH